MYSMQYHSSIVSLHYKKPSCFFLLLIRNDTKFCGELFNECFGSAGSFQGIGYKTAKNSMVHEKGLYVDS